MDIYDGRLPHDPSPEKIRELCAQIQATWTPSETRRRAAFTRARLRVKAFTTQTAGTQRRVRFVPSLPN